MSNNDFNDQDELAPYDYELPEDAIAQVPLDVRSNARLLDATGSKIVDRHVFDLPDMCEPHDVLVVNDTKVFPARIMLFKATGGKVEILLIESLESGSWVALANPSKGLSSGTVLFDSTQAPAVEIIERLRVDKDSPVKLLVRLVSLNLVQSNGVVPLPPYIKTPLANPDRYQTVFANQSSSVAAPTAGLHLDERVLDALRAKDVKIVKIELAVGLDTFLPIKSKLITGHKIHTERYHVEPDAWEIIANAKRVTAVGTTVVRTLETVALTGTLSGRSSLFIHGDYKYKVIDRLMTNFHIPRSSLLLLVEAFVGSRWKEIYAHGLSNGYRFLSFGDAMLLERRSGS